MTFDGSREVGGGVTSFAFRADRPLRARAGQHGILALGATVRKPFSLASAPEEDLVLIGTSLGSGSAFKKRLSGLRVGDTVGLRGPVNTFTLDDAGPRVVMLGQGVGVTPLRSMLAHITLTKQSLDSTLIHVASAGHAYRDDTEKWAGTAHYPEHSGQFRAVTADAAEASPSATFFIAGASAFVSATASLLREHGVPGKNIREDKYLFYKPSREREVQQS